MSVLLRLECINHNWGLPPEMLLFVPLLNGGKQLPPRQWVAEITGRSPRFKYERQFLRGKIDYSKSNSVGTRGVYAYYILEDGKVYDVCSPQTWRRNDRYYCIVKDGQQVRLTEEDVDRWLKDRSE